MSTEGVGWPDDCHKAIVLTLDELRQELIEARSKRRLAKSFSQLQKEKLEHFATALGGTKTEAQRRLADTAPTAEEKIYYRFCNNLVECRSEREKYQQPEIISPDVESKLLHIHTTTNQKELTYNGIRYFSPFISTTSDSSALVKTSLGLTGVGDENMKTVLKSIYVFKVADNGQNIKYPPSRSAMCGEEGECALDTRKQSAASCFLLQTDNPFYGNVQRNFFDQLTQRNIDLGSDPLPIANPEFGRVGNIKDQAQNLDLARRRFVASTGAITPESVRKYELWMLEKEAFEEHLSRFDIKPPQIRSAEQVQELRRRQGDVSRRFAPSAGRHASQSAGTILEEGSDEENLGTGGAGQAKQQQVEAAAQAIQDGLGGQQQAQLRPSRIPRIAQNPVLVQAQPAPSRIPRVPQAHAAHVQQILANPPEQAMHQQIVLRPRRDPALSGHPPSRIPRPT